MNPMTDIFGDAEVWNVDVIWDGQMRRITEGKTRAAAAEIVAVFRAAGERAWAVCDGVAL